MRITERRILPYVFVILLFLASLPGIAGAAVYNLCADQTTITMPDGAVIPAWGFDLFDDGVCTPTVPGPTLTVGVGEPLVINLTNNLAEPVSLHILGQVLSNNSGPVMSGGRVMSFTHETPAGGGTGTYQWNSFKPGSYLLQSGTNPAKQVQMGLFAPVIKDTGAGLAYLGVPYDKQRIVVFHEVDPAIQNAIAAGDYGTGKTITSSTHRDPHYYLINGKAYPQTSLDPGGTDPIAPDQKVLLRFFNGGLESHVPQIEGLGHMTIVAEDGNRLAFFKEQYNFEFPAARTADAVVTPGAGKYPIYDARLDLTNAAAATMGGMLAYLEVAAIPPTPPVAQDQTITTPEDTAVAITLTATDVNNDPLTFAIVTGPANGALAGTPPNVTYTPNANYFGPDSFTFKANDGALDSNVATVAITVTPVNDPPVANDQAVTTPEDTAIAITLTGSDPENDPLTFAIVTGPTNGALTGTPPNVTYTPNANYFGPDSFTFKANDGTVDSNVATVSITVTPVNDPPVAYDQAVTTPEDTALAITLTGSDPDNDPLTFAIVTGPTNGALAGTPPNVTYTPNANYFGPDSFTFKVNDGTFDSNVATVSITVNPVNDPPVAYDQTITTAEEQSKGILLTASDLENDPLAYTVVSGPANGVLTGIVPNLIYTPNVNYFGPDSFTFKVNDGVSDSNIATVSITVTPVNDPPVADAQAVITPQNTPRAIILTGSDPDLDPLTFAIVLGPTNGALSGVPPNVTYTPNANYSGPDSFTFKVNDGTVDSIPATVSITVTAVNSPPVANVQAVITPEDAAIAIALTGSDLDNDPLTFAIVTGPTNGALAGTPPNVIYTPNANYFGPDSFTFKVNDGTLDSLPATVSITVTPVNDPPVITSTPVLTATVGVPYSYQVVANDPDNDPLIYSLTSPPAGMTISGAGLVTWTPALAGPQPVTVNVADGSASATQNFTIQVAAPFSALLHFSTASNATTVPGVAAPYNSADIYGWDGVSFARVFSASAAGLPAAANIDGLEIVGDLIYMSFTADGILLPGIGVVNDEDIVIYNRATAAWSMFFHGSDVGLTTTNEDVDAFTLVPGGVIISTLGEGAVTGVAGNFLGQDLLLCMGTFGPTTTCTWSMYFDGSDVTLTADTENIDGVALSGGNIYLSTTGAYRLGPTLVPLLTGGGDDVFVCNSPTTGVNTACGSYTRYFDGSGAGVNGNIDAIDLP